MEEFPDAFGRAVAATSALLLLDASANFEDCCDDNIRDQIFPRG